MTRWFRAYADTHRNPKVASLSDRQFRLWHNLLCIAAENEGVIPSAEELKSILNVRLDYLLRGLEGLLKGGLIDPLRGGYTPRNWDKRQYKSDTSTGRVHKFRAKRNVSETPPDTEADTETEKKEEVGGKPPSYAFFGQTIRLTPQHLDRWRRTFHTILDIEAELLSLDGWWQQQPEDKRSNWFHATQAMLNKKHQQTLAAQKDAEAGPIWDGMP
jgi:hypothetical protein